MKKIVEKKFEALISNYNLSDYLCLLTDPRKKAVKNFHRKYLDAMAIAKGSRKKHQPWEGGYMDHLVEMLFMGDLMFKTFSQYRKMPFTFESVIIVVYFHDIEKIFRDHGETIKKSSWYLSKLPNMGITFSEAELNALKFIHGEPDSLHNPESRIMNELASFCHAIDNMSARLWYNYGNGSGELGVLGIK